ncbi:MAG: hypothetical protein AMJ53_17070 [Gammaproteobacteria bacterium SG8_11]|nr:MAG: hypothetical protein AMJ53_17070 [Gammaproteobacteria bacterium SG8_11]
MNDQNAQKDNVRKHLSHFLFGLMKPTKCFSISNVLVMLLISFVMLVALLSWPDGRRSQHAHRIMVKANLKTLAVAAQI